MFQPAMAAIDAASEGPSKTAQLAMQAYSEPERLTPSNRTVRPPPSTKWLPTMRTDSPAACAVTGGPVNTARATPTSAPAPIRAM